MLAISGLNITMIAGSFYMMFLLAGIGHRGTSFLTILIVVIYVGLAGAGLPVQRAGYAAILVLVGILVGRPASLLNALCLAFFVILLCNPKSLWNIGFQLSFLSVFSLILAIPVFSRWNIRTLSLGSSFAVLFGTFPVVLYHFNIFSPISLLANLVAIPVFDAALFSALFTLIFSGVPFLSVLWVKGSSWILGVGLFWVQSLSTWRWGYWFLERPSFGQLVGYYTCVAMILFLYKRAFYGKRYLMACFVGCWIFCLGSFFIQSGKKEFELTLLASGRNQIVHSNFSNGTHWLLNTGRGFPSDQGEWLVAPFLRRQGIQRLEGILFSDLSKRNTGGIASLLRDFPVHYLLYPAAFPYGSEEFRRAIRSRGRQTRTFQRGDAIVMGKERIRVLAASQRGTVLRVESGSWRILFISHWDPELFSELLRHPADLEEVHAVYLPVLKRTIPVEFQEWLELARPSLVVLPDINPEFMAYLEAQRIPALDLKSVGALSFRSRGSRLELSSFLKGPMGFFAYS
ncbi:MAG: ComEC/Rec2 family competence protein [Candidatus Omnitrophota bacterium]